MSRLSLAVVEGDEMIKKSVRPKIKVPKRARVGEVITIKTLIAHPMESGVRRDENETLIPRDIIKRFEARFEGQVFFFVDLHPAISADPYFSFHFKVPGPGLFSFHWQDDQGKSWSLQQGLSVT